MTNDALRNYIRKRGYSIQPLLFSLRDLAREDGKKSIFSAKDGFFLFAENLLDFVEIWSLPCSQMMEGKRETEHRGFVLFLH